MPTKGRQVLLRSRRKAHSRPRPGEEASTQSQHHRGKPRRVGKRGNSVGPKAPMEAAPSRPSPPLLAPCAETLAAVGSIDQPAEQLDHGLNSKLLTYKGEINDHPIHILVDGGSMGDFISSRLVEQLALETQTVATFSILFPNGETSPCNKEIINACLRIQEHQEEIHPKVVPLPHHDLILRKPWLEKWNPCIDWRTNQIHITRDGHTYAINQVTSRDPSHPP